MAWSYFQRTGELADASGEIVAKGYSGMGAAKNRPECQCQVDRGPIPRGRYRLDVPIDTKTHGPYVLWLDPDQGNAMCGRSAFGIHGDSLVHPGMASEGCIILSRMVREKMWHSADHDLEVTA